MAQMDAEGSPPSRRRGSVDCLGRQRAGRRPVSGWAPPSPAPAGGERRRRGLLPRAAVLAAALLGCVWPGAAQEPAVMKVTFMALDRGEATLVQGPGGRVVLLGAGVAAEAPEVQRRLRALGIRRLPLLIAQTWKPGHVGGLRALIAPFHVERILFNPIYGAAPECEAFYKHARALGDAERLLFQSVTPGEEITLSHQPLFQATAHSPTGPMLPRYTHDANCSLVAEFGLERASFLTLGDTTIRHQRDYWRQRDPKPWGHLLRIGRAGAADSLAAEHLRPLRTRIAVIPIPRRSGASPAPATLAALKQAGVRVYRTDRDGTVTATLRPGGAVTVAIR